MDFSEYVAVRRSCGPPCSLCAPLTEEVAARRGLGIGARFPVDGIDLCPYDVLLRTDGRIDAVVARTITSTQALDPDGWSLCSGASPEECRASAVHLLRDVPTQPAITATLPWNCVDTAPPSTS